MNIVEEKKKREEDTMNVFKARMAAPENRTALIKALNVALPNNEKRRDEIIKAIGKAETDDQLRNVAATLLRIKFALLEDKDPQKEKHFAFGDVLKETLLAPGGQQPRVEIKFLCPEKDFTEKCERKEEEPIEEEPIEEEPIEEEIRKRASIGGKRKTRKHNKKGKKKTMRKKGKKKTMRKKGKKKTMRKKGKKKGKKKTKKKRR